MIYLKKIAKDIIDDKDILNKINNCVSDRDIFRLLSKYTSEEKVISIFEAHYGVKYIDLNILNIDKEILNPFNIAQLMELGVLPYEFNPNNKEYKIAINDFMDKKIVNSLQKMLNRLNFKADLYFTFTEDMQDYYKKLNDTGSSKKQLNNSINKNKDFDVISWLDNIINKGINLNASDIHIEKTESGLQVRYRVDGVLVEKSYYDYSDDEVANIFVRVKIISDMDISEKRKPQDGRIDNYRYNGRVYDLRVSTVSLMIGEKVVMRIFDKNEGFRTYEEIGFSEKDIVKIKEMLLNNNGIIYLSGATGSGKTTTLYTMIQTLNKDSVNIYTIENPVERTIENVNQIQIDNIGGITYPNTLRALLRQDPDIIVVGEIRDGETADLSIRASLTGHLVLSTLHANNSLDSISRLLDMNIEPYLISTSSLGFLSQRLVRVLCPHCKEKVDKLETNEKIYIDNIIKKNNLEDIGDHSFYKAVGCKHCHGGYSGRIALVEIVEMTDSLKTLLGKTTDITLIKEEALKDGFEPIAIQGLRRAIDGLTSVEELIRQVN